MTAPAWIGVYAFAAVAFCAMGLGLKIWHLLRMPWGGLLPSAKATVDAPVRLGFGQAAWRFFTRPALQFHSRSSRTWTCGYIFYHTAIFMVVAGYAVSSLILGGHWLAGNPIPDFATGVAGPGSRSLTNLLALVFGNAEVLPSTFLYGRFAAVFRMFATCELPFAVTGNLCLLFTVVCKRSGAVRHDLDPAARNLRLTGGFSGEHLLVRLLILSIIASEFIGRFGWIPGIAYYHALLGMTLIAIVPCTYLAHIPLAPLAIWLAVQRRRNHAVA